MSQLGCTLQRISNSKVPINMVMIAPNTQRRENGMGKKGGGGGGDDGGRTVECLRGRLLAERVASKAAKEEAQQMAKRLEEIEKKLGEEIKSRDRAERKLRHALRKLESLKILDFGSSWDLSSSSSPPPPSSPRCLSGYRTSSEEKKPDSSATDSEQCGSIDGGKEEVLGLMHSEEEVEGSLCSSGTLQSHLKEELNEKKDEAIGDCSSQHDNVGDNVGDVRTETVELQSENDENNKMAIVPASIKLNTETYAPKKMNPDVQGVLLALRQVREQLQYCIARRRSDFCTQDELYGPRGRLSSRVLQMP